MAGTPKTEGEVMKEVTEVLFAISVGAFLGYLSFSKDHIESHHPIEPTITIVTTNGISDTTYIYKEK